MNPVLAQIYGRGFDKTASDNTIDLDTISGADLLAGIESGQIVLDGMDKEAGDDEIDLTQLTGTELLELMDEVDDGGEVLSKMASDGSAEYWDMAGRIMAHAYNDELNKTAGPDFIDLDDIDGETMMELIESGEYELIEDVEKVASQMPDGSWKPLRQMSKKQKAQQIEYRKGRKGKQKGTGLRGMDADASRKAQAAFKRGEKFRQYKGQPKKWAALARKGAGSTRGKLALMGLGGTALGAGGMHLARRNG